MSAARKVGINHASGELIAFLNGDDLWHKEKLALQIAILASDKSAALAYCNFFDFTKRDLSDAKLIKVKQYSAETANFLETFLWKTGRSSRQ